MAIVVFCSTCAKDKGWPKPSMRTTSAPCDICGGHEKIRQRKINPRTGQPEIKVIELKNFEHDSRFLPGTQEEARLQEPLM
jgi:hypothetical protein